MVSLFTKAWYGGVNTLNKTNMICQTCVGKVKIMAFAAPVPIDDIMRSVSFKKKKKKNPVGSSSKNLFCHGLKLIIKQMSQ